MPPRVFLPSKTCVGCGTLFSRRDGEEAWDYRNRSYCSKDCYHRQHTGENHWRWSDGSTPRYDGYFRVQINGVRKYVHRRKIEKVLGRELRSDEHVHHINGDPTDNRIENMVILSNSEHRKIEAKKAVRNHGSFAKKDSLNNRA